MKSTLIHAAGVLIKVLELKFKLAADHSRRVAKYALILAREMNIPIKMQERIYLAGLVHDIGKIAIKSTCLLKQGPLTVEEWEEVKKHPLLSYDILSSVPGMKEIALISLHHHERYDGMGYPKGLKGDKIPLGARVIAVSDSFDAMTSDRVYRPRLSRQEAENELRRCAGTQFDPQIAEVFCLLLKKDYELGDVKKEKK